MQYVHIIKERLYVGISIAFFFLRFGDAHGQQATFTIKANKNTILIGEPISLELKAIIPANEPVRFFSIDSIPHMEVLEKGNIDSNNTATGTTLTQVITITSFDSGYWTLPPQFIDSKKVTDSISFNIRYSSFDTQQPYHDVDKIIEIDTPKKLPWWYYTLPIFIIAALYFALRRKRKKEIVAVPVKTLTPYETAMQTLESLQNNSLPTKEFYTRLIDVLKTYLKEKNGRTSITVIENSLQSYIQQLPLQIKNKDELQQVVLLSEFVKFAKYIPSHEEQNHSLNTVRASIQSIEQNI